MATKMLKAKTAISVVLLSLVPAVGGCGLENWQARGPRVFLVPDKYERIADAISRAEVGDTVLVKAGSYFESITFKDGIRLVGEGRDKTTIQYSQCQGRVIKVEDCNSGSISGLNLELVPTGEGGEQLAVVFVKRSSKIEIADCRIAGSLVNGLSIRNGGKAFVRNCVMESNGRCGIYVQGKGTSAELKDNICQKNQSRGICVDGGSFAILEDSICRDNNDIGIYVCGDGTKVMLRNNKCLSNGSDGICFGDGTSGRVEDTTCEQNKRIGFYAYGRNTSAVLQNNMFRKNAQSGVFFYLADGLVEDSISEENSANGISITNAESDVNLTGNHLCRRRERGCGKQHL
jgi:parallel beta-helix repeat protein